MGPAVWVGPQRSGEAGGMDWFTEIPAELMTWTGSQDSGKAGRWIYRFLDILQRGCRYMN